MTTPDPLPELIASRRTHERYLAMRVDTVRYASGREGEIDVVEHPGGVTLVAFDAHDRLLLVRQYRHAIGRELLELPAGTLDPDESPEVCAERELQEETGYRPRTMERLGGFYTAPGYCSEYLHVFLCRDLVESRLQGDEDAIHLDPMRLAEVLGLVASGAIEDAKTVGALLLYLAKRGDVSLE